ncbi:MAG: hypothetical protein HY332_25615 [Chloroflexi bacterium]|nr:hypothetical protein [Chloroflexota bacterium]
MARIGSSGGYNALGPAGWLFADGLLGLVMLYLAVGTHAAPPPPTPTPPMPTAAPAVSAAAPTRVLPTPTPAHACLDRQPVTARVRFSPALLASPATRAAVVAEVRAQLADAFAEHTMRGREAGMVLTFGGAGGAGGGLPARGNELAREVNAVLAQAPAFATAAYREFHDLDAPEGTAEVAVYFLSGC